MIRSTCGRNREDLWSREWAWDVFQTIVKECKTEGGFAVFENVNNPKSDLGDETPSTFSGKTLKYFYLLFSDALHVDLHKTIFTAGAHLLPVLD